MTPDRNLRQRVEQLERRLGLLERGHGREATLLPRPLVRLAVTFEGGSGSIEYPETGNVLPIVFIDASFTQEVGQQDLAKELHHTEVQTVAMNLCGEHLQPLSLVVVLEANGVQGRHFFIIKHCGGIGLALGRLGADLRPSDLCAQISCTLGTAETVTYACNTANMVGKAGDVAVLAKINPVCSGESGEAADCLSLCEPASGEEEDCQETSDCTPKWVVLVVAPRAFCPVMHVKDGGACLKEEHSRIYLWWDPDEQSHAEEVIPLVTCEEESGSEECDLSSEWTPACPGSEE